MRLYSIAALLLTAGFVVAQPKATPYDQPPEWAKTAIWYQIFAERFNNGDPKNDPTGATASTPPIGVNLPANWRTTSWTSNWYEPDSWMEAMGKSFSRTVHNRRYGGDLQGVLNKLDYLKKLGINALFFNPINDASSMHKYDARNYHHVDVNFGPDPDGDIKIIASENPADPETWKWTSADKLFLQLVDEAHRRGMKVIMDYSWNHTGTLFWAWQDVLKNQAQSKYKDWYEIKAFDDPATSQNEFSYSGWAGTNSLPEIKKVQVVEPRISGHPYEGNIFEGAKAHIFDVAKRWLAPNGDASKGIDGYRLDVADQIGLGFWRDFRKVVRGTKANAYLVGEIWWQQWPDHLMDPTPYCKGDMFDAVMFYQAYSPARYFFAKTDFPITAEQLKDSLLFQWNRLRPENRYAMMNTSSTHDAPRLLTCFYNPNKYKYRSTPNDDKNYKTGKPNTETYRRVSLYLMHLFTTVGAPQIWNGEEMGMWGADDPDCRKPLWWQGLQFAPETRNNVQPGPSAFDPVGFDPAVFALYKKLIAIRNSELVLQTGVFEFVVAEGGKLAYKRTNGENEILVCFNMGDKEAFFELPPAFKYRNLLDNKSQHVGKIRLSPLSAAILQRQPVK